ncbi:methylthioribulose-1-phosphate dehydratase [Lysobacteraceae bacterium NML120232]|nr:methylthioribulose-1-phosphate dehydratase [Xanthomonadaceae bacterium NML08-0793]PJK10713.1 methylthioribulose-1-phosphate dehydratase [Xanthomonadaceae bacterium NML120232]
MKTTLPYDSARAAALAEVLASHVRELGEAGWTPATSSNFSMRLDAQHALITVSGREKRKLTANDLMVIDLNGQPVGNQLRPSAETLLHTQLYQRFADIGCVLHTHSLHQTVASRLFARQGYVQFQDYELQKAFHGNTTHEGAMRVPVFANTQHMPTLAAQVEAALDAEPMWGYLIEGHGLYAWGRDIDETRRHLEAFEFLLQCELKMMELAR